MSETTAVQDPEKTEVPASEIPAGGDGQAVKETGTKEGAETDGAAATEPETPQELSADLRQRALDAGYADDELAGVDPEALDAELVRLDRLMVARERKPAQSQQTPSLTHGPTSAPAASKPPDAVAQIEAELKLDLSDEVFPETKKAIGELNSHYAKRMAVLEAKAAELEARVQPVATWAEAEREARTTAEVEGLFKALPDDQRALFSAKPFNTLDMKDPLDRRTAEVIQTMCDLRAVDTKHGVAFRGLNALHARAVRAVTGKIPVGSKATNTARATHRTLPQQRNREQEAVEKIAGILARHK